MKIQDKNPYLLESKIAPNQYYKITDLKEILTTKKINDVFSKLNKPIQERLDIKSEYYYTQTYYFHQYDAVRIKLKKLLELIDKILNKTYSKIDSDNILWPPNR